MLNFLMIALSIVTIAIIITVSLNTRRILHDDDSTDSEKRRSRYTYFIVCPSVSVIYFLMLTLVYM